MKKEPGTFSKSTLIALGTALALIILEGIIGNRADSIFILVWPYIEQSVVANLVLYICTTFAISICLVTALYWRQQQKVASRMFSIARKVLDLDDSLLLELASLTPSADIEQEMQRVLVELLSYATAAFEGQVLRAAILLPDASKDYLQCWASYQMPQDSINNMKFYIGHDQKLLATEKGMAGEAFKRGEIVVGHLIQINGNWVCEDNGNYKNFIGRRPYPPYTSFVNVPIMGISPDDRRTDMTCLGVVCFDSANKHVFDSEESKTMLTTFARRIASALFIRDFQKIR